MDAQFKLGSAYDTGAGLFGNGENAKKYYLKAATQGHAEAQNSMGSIYQAEENYTEALYWYKKASEQNHALAINNMAYFHHVGLGTPQNLQKAQELYIKSANMSEPRAMYNLALLLASDLLGKENIIEACAWMDRAMRYSEDEDMYLRATKAVDTCIRKQTKRDTEKFKAISNNWRPTLVSKN